MNEKISLNTKLYFTGIVTIGIWSLLAWDHYHGGVPSHHLLNRKDLPAISNWWGGLLLPLLTWFLLDRIQKRFMQDKVEKSTVLKRRAKIIYRFTCALLFGILLSLFFTFGYTDISGYMFIVLFLLALFFPVYRAECLLGFVIGMTFTFGGVLPTAVGSILVLIGALLYLYVRPAILYISSTVVRKVSSNKNEHSK